MGGICRARLHGSGGWGVRAGARSLPSDKNALVESPAPAPGAIVGRWCQDFPRVKEGTRTENSQKWCLDKWIHLKLKLRLSNHTTLLVENQNDEHGLALIDARWPKGGTQ